MFDFIDSEFVFLACAIVGGVLFVLRLALLFIGIGDHGGHDGDVGDVGDIGDAGHVGDVGGFDEVHGVEMHGGDAAMDTDFSFKFVSIQGISAFFLMFGLVGLAITKGNGGIFWSILGGTAAGLVTVYIISLIFLVMTRLQSSGTMRIENAVGQTGTVYLTIPANGTGRVNVSVQGSRRELDAISVDKKRIKTGERIRVVKVLDNGLLVVEKISIDS